ncbi:unnamed protein product [Ostreobium quekettii]|uniref:CN hydrolase domain-containing protein n=1 Tax=Ostreobium quekettii TaxID=121088 RepID=A0A8S1J549_9CHLO|nr:unnamed protein product [Ostreobium quekettii]|eukprot:evm.model.scf_2977.1 EVM.evm.TU.scf_2977.1   scf_2977:600-2580(+)
MTSVGHLETNYSVCRDLALQAANANCRMLFLPECFSLLGDHHSVSIEKAESLDGPAMARYTALAKELGIWLSLGGFQETGPDKDHIYNTHVIVSDKGEIVAKYRKIHLFNVDIPGGPMLLESRFTAAGEELVTCDAPVGRLGLTVCYDLRFPELYQKLRFEHGADILLIPSAFTKPTGEAHWEVLLRARAVECQCYVIAAAQAGKHNDKRESYGHSMIIDPWGAIVAKLEDPLATGIAVADVDLGYVNRLRATMPIEGHREMGLKALSGMRQ